LGYYQSFLGHNLNLICIHGNSLDGNIFDAIHVDGFNKTIINLPGHGGTEIGNVKTFSDIVDSVFEDIKLMKDVIFLGTSLGGHIAHHLLAKVSPLGIITISSPPLNLASVGQAFLPHPLGHLLFQSLISADESIALADSFLALRKDRVLDIANSIRSTNPFIRELIGLSLSRGEFSDEVKLLSDFSGLKMLILPTNDTMVNQDYIKSLNIAQVSEIEGGHVLTVDNPEALNELLSRELSKLRK
jgi:pimeloyl-ACP methyl ester carboxylesterase